MKKIIIYISAFILFVLIMSSFGTIPSGFRGVTLRFGGTTGEIKKEGLYFINPLTDAVAQVSIMEEKQEVTAKASSLDLQAVDMIVAINYAINEMSVVDIYKNTGTKYKSILIEPNIQEAIKSVSARYTADQLITKREVVREEIKTTLTGKLEPMGIIIKGVNIVNFNFSESFNDAIEAKVTAEQNALASKNKLEQIKFEAEQAIVAAKGKAEALQIEGDALAKNPQVKELRAIEKWNGILPQVTGNSTPFINLK